MLKTREWLKSQFETGDVPTGEDYADLLDSYVHKGDLGNVGKGEMSAVSGDAVWRAIREAVGELALERLVREVLEKMLPEALARYATTATLESRMAGMAERTWVSNQLADKADKADVSKEMEKKADLTELEPYALKTGLESLKDDLTERLGERLTAESLTPILEERLSGYLPSAGLREAVLKEGFEPSASTRKYIEEQGFTKTADLAKAQAELNTVIQAKADKSTLGSYALKTELPAAVDTGGFATKAELTSYQSGVNLALLGMASKQYAQDAATEAEERVANGLAANSTIVALAEKVNDLVGRTNTLSHVACGSETMEVCLMDIQQVAITQKA